MCHFPQIVAFCITFGIKKSAPAQSETLLIRKLGIFLNYWIDRKSRRRFNLGDINGRISYEVRDLFLSYFMLL